MNTFEKINQWVNDTILEEEENNEYEGDKEEFFLYRFNNDLSVFYFLSSIKERSIYEYFEKEKNNEVSRLLDYINKDNDLHIEYKKIGDPEYILSLLIYKIASDKDYFSF